MNYFTVNFKKILHSLVSNLLSIICIAVTIVLVLSAGFGAKGYAEFNEKYTTISGFNYNKLMVSSASIEEYKTKNNLQGDNLGVLDRFLKDKKIEVESIEEYVSSEQVLFLDSPKIAGAIKNVEKESDIYTNTKTNFVSITQNDLRGIRLPTEFTKESEVIPVILTIPYMLDNYYLDIIKDDKLSAKLVKQKQDQLLGTTIEFGRVFLKNQSISKQDARGKDLEYSKLPFKFKIIGFTDELTDRPKLLDLKIPSWAIERLFKFKNPYLIDSTDTKSSSFEITTKDKINWNKLQQDQNEIGNELFILQSYQVAKDNYNIENQKRWMYIIGAILFIISSIIIFTTLSKMLMENQKELAVYVCVGATKSNIFVLYAIYTSLLITFSTILGAGLSFLLNSGLYFGGYFQSYVDSIMLSTNNFSINPNILTFWSIDWILLIGTYFVFLVMGLLINTVVLIGIYKKSFINSIKSN